MEDIGSFWFFDFDNFEFVVKVIDGIVINGNYWVFYGVFFDVVYEFCVIDIEMGQIVMYFNFVGIFGSQGDVDVLLVFSSKVVSSESLMESVVVVDIVFLMQGICMMMLIMFCFVDCFEVSVLWIDFQGGIGIGQILLFIIDIGSFWFFDSENVEFVFKVIDGMVFNGCFWVFYGVFFNVVFEIIVIDMVIGVVKMYSNLLGIFVLNGDIQVF